MLKNFLKGQRNSAEDVLEDVEHLKKEAKILHIKDIVKSELNLLRIDFNRNFHKKQPSGKDTTGMTEEYARSVFAKIEPMFQDSDERKEIFKSHMENFETFLQTGDIKSPLNLKDEESQFFWGVALGYYAINPEIQGQWDARNQASRISRSTIWRRIASSSYMQQELQKHAQIVESAVDNPDTKIIWSENGYPNISYCFVPAQNIIIDDMLWTLVAGVDAAATAMNHEIAHSKGTQFTKSPRMEKIEQLHAAKIKEMETFTDASQKDDWLRFGKQAQRLQIEQQYRFYFLDELENMYANRYAVNFGGDFDKAHLNELESDINVGARYLKQIKMEEAEKEMKTAAEKRIMHVKSIARNSFFANNGLIDNHKMDDWHAINLFPELLSGIDADGRKMGAMESFERIREICDQFEKLQPNKGLRILNEKIYQNRMTTMSKRRVALVDEFFDRFVAPHMEEIYQKADKELENQVNNPQQSQQNQQSQQGQQSQGQGQQGQGQGQGQGEEGGMPGMPPLPSPPMGNPGSGQQQNDTKQQNSQQQSGNGQGQQQFGDKGQQNKGGGNENGSGGGQGDKSQQDKDGGNENNSGGGQGDKSQQDKGGENENNSGGGQGDKGQQDKDGGNENGSGGGQGDKSQQDKDGGNENGSGGGQGDKSEPDKDGGNENGSGGGQNNDSQQNSGNGNEGQEQNGENGKGGEQKPPLYDPNQFALPNTDIYRPQISDEDIKEMMEKAQSIRELKKQAEENGIKANDLPDRDKNAKDDRGAPQEIAGGNNSGQQGNSQNSLEDYLPQNELPTLISLDDMCKLTDDNMRAARFYREGNWDEYQKYVAQFSNEVAMAKKIIGEIIKQNKLDSVRRGHEQVKQKMTKLPIQGGRTVDLQKHIALQQKLRRNDPNISKKDLERFRTQYKYSEDEIIKEIKIPQSNFGILIDGSGSMTGKPFDNALAISCILYEAARSFKEVNVYIYMMGQPYPLTVALPDDKTKEVAKRLESVRKGQGGCNDFLIPAVKEFLKDVSTDMQKKPHIKSGFTHIFSITDGGNNDYGETDVNGCLKLMLEKNEQLTYDSFFMGTEYGGGGGSYTKPLIKEMQNAGCDRIDYVDGIEDGAQIPSKIMEMLKKRMRHSQIKEGLANSVKQKLIVETLKAMKAR